MEITAAIRKALRHANPHRPTLPLVLAVGAMLGLLFSAFLLAPPASTPTTASGPTALTGSVATDRAALVDSYNATKGPNWQNRTHTSSSKWSSWTPVSPGRPGQQQPPGVPTNFTASTGSNPGVVTLRWTPGANATVHQVDYKEGDNGQWRTWSSQLSGNASRVTITGLQAGQKYWFAVKAGRGSSGNYVWSAWTPVARAWAGQVKPPGVPTNFTASAGLTPGVVGLTWSSVPNATVYRVDYKEDGGQWRTWSSRLSHSFAIFTGLKPGQKYWFAVKAGRGSSGNYVWSAWTPVRWARAGQQQPPGVPANFTASTSPTPGAVTLTWTPGVNATVHQLDYKKDGGSWGTWSSQLLGYASGVTVTGLQAGQKYWFAVRAGRGSSGNYVWSNWTPVDWTWAGHQVQPPGVPTNLTASTGNNDGQATLTWKAADAEWYQVAQKRGDNGDWLHLDPVYSDLPPPPVEGGYWTLHETITGLEPGQKYWFGVRAGRGAAGNEVWSAWSDVVSVTLGQKQPPGVPTNLTASTGDNDGEVTLNWTPGADATVHQVAYRTRSGGDYQHSETTGDANSLTISGLTPGLEYWFTVRAGRGAAGSELWSSWWEDANGKYLLATASGGQPPSAPTNLTASTGDNDGEVALTWTPGAYATVHQVAYRTRSGGDYQHLETTGDANSLTISGLTPGLEYWFTVRAGRGAAGSELWSSWWEDANGQFLLATASGGQPVLSATVNDDGLVDLTLSNGTGNWWFRINQGTCTAASGSAYRGIGGYRPGTYQVRAYSDSGCRNQIGATTSFTILETVLILEAVLSATVNDDRSVDLTLSDDRAVGLAASDDRAVGLAASDGPSNWWFRINWWTCTPVSGGTVSNIQGYRPGTYRVRAFSDRNCAYQIAETSFTIFLDKAPLVAFYNATGGPTTWINNTNWNTDKPIGDWHGVTTDDDGRVTKIILSSNNLTGSIPTDLVGLTKLQTLTLRGNRLTGEIPDLSALSDTLGWLNLERNELNGNIPTWLGEFTELRGLGLGHNRLSGTIPAELGNLNNLRVLYLDHQSYFRGQTFPANFEKIYNNDFYYLNGSIPAELGNLKQLEVLDLSDNRLSGNIPSQLTFLKNLETLNLGRNQLTGTVPELSNLTNMNRLYLQDNSELRGTIPVGTLSNLTALNLQGTQVSVVPPQHANLAAIQRDRAALVELYNLAGGSAWEWGNGCSRWEVDNNNANVSGWCGVTVDSNGRVAKLSLPGGDLNNYYRSLKSPLGNWRNLSILGDLTALTHLDLSGNDLGGVLPAELDQLTKLTHLNLSGNAFQGDIEDQITGRDRDIEWGNLQNLVELDLSNNRRCELIGEGPLSTCNHGLSGYIPVGIPYLPNLSLLNLSGNQLTGGAALLLEHDGFTGNADATIKIDLSDNPWSKESRPDYWNEFQAEMTRGFVELGVLTAHQLTGYPKLDAQSVRDYAAAKGLEQIQVRAVTHVAASGKYAKAATWIIRGAKLVGGASSVVGWVSFTVEGAQIVNQMLSAVIDFLEKGPGQVVKNAQDKYLGTWWSCLNQNNFHLNAKLAEEACAHLK